MGARTFVLAVALGTSVANEIGLQLVQQKARSIPAVPHYPLISGLHEQRLDIQAQFSDAQKEQVIKDLQAFIQNSDEGFATLVLIGDSTMSGLTSSLLSLTEEIYQSHELLYVSNDRKRAVHYAGFVKPGGEWVRPALTLDWVQTAAKRAQESTRVLHAKGCKSGGGLETYMSKSGPLKGLVVHHWGFLPEYTDFCWDTCMTEAMAALKPTAVVWNIGFHLLNHQFSPSVCAMRHNPTKLNCGNYKEMVQMGIREMLNAGVRDVVWRHTNYLCERIQGRHFPMTVAALQDWHNETYRPALEEKCKEECPDYAENGLTCYDWFFDAHTTERFYSEANAAVDELIGSKGDEQAKHIHKLDAFRRTKECCKGDCSQDTHDGEHYSGVDQDLMAVFAGILAGRAADA